MDSTGTEAKGAGRLLGRLYGDAVLGNADTSAAYFTGLLMVGESGWEAFRLGYELGHQDVTPVPGDPGPWGWTADGVAPTPKGADLL